MRKNCIVIYLRIESNLQTHALKVLSSLDKEVSQSFTLRDWETWQGKLIGIKTIFINDQVLKYFNTDRDKNQLREEQSIWPSGDCPVVHSSSSKTK